MEININYDGLLYRLKRLDEDASLIYGNENRFDCIIVGGSALILLRCLERATHDIDVLESSPQLRELFEKYDFNQRVNAYIDNFPYNYQDRFVKIDIDTKTINYYTASLEDIIIAKLCSYRDTDYDDVTQPDILDKINWDLLEQLSKEAKDSALNDKDYNSFLFNYNEYVRRYKRERTDI